ncbi:MAG: tetratricopeptide repeat protein, partial [Muribaculaceae bacterium]|nr:tetratricopeptide repeat protein [Muribaculaceae bacterium]
MLATAVAVAVLGCGCSSSRNTAATRNYQAFITRYNIHYNGDKHYRETLEDMERNYPDDFSRMLFVHPAEARGVSGVPQPSGDFTRSVEKAQKAIQLRSIKKRPAGPSATPQQREWKRRTEYNPFLHNSWLMLGRAEYMNGDFAIAANTF